MVKQQQITITKKNLIRFAKKKKNYTEFLFTHTQWKTYWTIKFKQIIIIQESEIEILFRILFLKKQTNSFESSTIANKYKHHLHNYLSVCLFGRWIFDRYRNVLRKRNLYTYELYKFIYIYMIKNGHIDRQII